MEPLESRKKYLGLMEERGEGGENEKNNNGRCDICNCDDNFSSEMKLLDNIVHGENERYKDELNCFMRDAHNSLSALDGDYFAFCKEHDFKDFHCGGVARHIFKLLYAIGREPKYLIIGGDVIEGPSWNGCVKNSVDIEQKIFLARNGENILYSYR